MSLIYTRNFNFSRCLSLDACIRSPAEMLITFPRKIFFSENASLFFRSYPPPLPLLPYRPSRSLSTFLSICPSFFAMSLVLSFLTLSSPSSAVLLPTTFFSVFTVQFLVPILPSFIVALFKLLMPRRQSSLLLSANE